MIYILLFLQLLLVQNVVPTNTELSLNKQNNENKLIMVNDYTLVNYVLPSNDIVETTFGLHDFEKKEEKHMLNKWASVFPFSSFPFSFFSFKEGREDTHLQKEVALLNRLIINATDGLLNMCDNMIAKTTSSLPLSYSLYTKLETEIRDNVVEEGLGGEEEDSGFFGFFSSSSKKKEDTKLVLKALEKDLDKDLADDARKQMYDYQLLRLALNRRESFLNSLCFDTFGAPYILYFNSVNNTLQSAFDVNPIKHFTVVVQNIIDNSYIRGLNKGFKKGYSKDKDKDKGLKYDFESDFNKEQKTTLVEKAKYILPILHKLEQRLPSYLSNIGRRSLTTDEYFANLRQFWIDIWEEALIAGHETPSKYELILLEQKRAQKALEEADRRAREEADRLIQDFKNKQLKKDAENYIREQEIFQEDRRQNYSVVEWEQLGRQIKLHVSGFTGSFISGVDGIIKVPVDYILGFASDTIWDLGKVAIMVLILIAICLRIYNKIVSFVFFKVPVIGKDV
jgi:hypothetical protein